jgi:hypothetical protein
MPSYLPSLDVIRKSARSQAKPFWVIDLPLRHSPQGRPSIATSAATSEADDIAATALSAKMSRTAPLQPHESFAAKMANRQRLSPALTGGAFPFRRSHFQLLRFPV